MDKTASTPAVYALVDDLFFVAKIRETARQIGVPLETVSQEEALRKALASGAASGVIVDMNCRSLDAVQVIRSLKSDPRGTSPCWWDSSGTPRRNFSARPSRRGWTASCPGRNW